MKTCPQCGRSLPATEEFFYRRQPPYEYLYTLCKACWLADRRAYNETHKAENAAKMHSYYESHKEQIAARKRAWEKRNRERINEHKREYQRRHLQTNPTIYFSRLVSAGVRRSLLGTKQGTSWETLAGYTVYDLMRHLESRFQPGMTWENRGKWHIDHIRPIASFSFDSYDDPQFKECWALSNLQPLWATDNLRKGAKVA